MMSAEKELGPSVNSGDAGAGQEGMASSRLTKTADRGDCRRHT